MQWSEGGGGGCPLGNLLPHRSHLRDSRLRTSLTLIFIFHFCYITVDLPAGSRGSVVGGGGEGEVGWEGVCLFGQSVYS